MIINTHTSEASHYYWPDGRPCYEVEKKDGSGMTKTTIAHARKMGLLPSVTTILKILDKPALNAWKVEQAALAVLTSPRLDGEADDAFVKRVLTQDREHEREGQIAADLGTEIHNALEVVIIDGFIGPAFAKYAVYVEPVLDALKAYGQMHLMESVVVGDGYAGKVDLQTTFGLGSKIIIDFKTCKSLPKSSYDEHRLQLSAYAACVPNVVNTVNIYISTTNPGEIKVCENPDFVETFEAFKALMKVWQWVNKYKPL